MVVIYEFKLNEREKMQEKMKKLSKTGEVKEIFINNKLGFEYKKNLKLM